MTDCLSFKILLGISLMLFLITIRTLIGIVPSLLATVIRWKESLNLEASVKLSRDRNLVTICATIPFCLIICLKDIYHPSFLNSFNNDARLWIIIGIFSTFVAIRTLLEHMLRPRRIQGKAYKAIVSVGYSFFIILTMLLMLVGGSFSLLDISEEHTQNVMLWLSAATYLLYLIRKLQIFNSSYSFFAGILYLCALEILPTGVLITSAVIF
jgi:hypothetical protein